MSVICWTQKQLKRLYPHPSIAVAAVQRQAAATTAAGKGIFETEQVVKQLSAARTPGEDNEKGGHCIEGCAGQYDDFSNGNRPGTEIESSDGGEKKNDGGQ